MKNAIAYIRVSTNGQTAEDKFGIEAQRERILEYAAKNDIQILEWKTDVISGVADARPELDRIMYGEVHNPPVEAVIVAKSDRIAREIKLYFWIQQNLIRKGIELISVVEDFGEMGAFSGILQAFVMFAAEQERVNIMKRTSGGRQVKAKKGGYSGGQAPMGYKVVDKQLVVNEAEAQVVRKVFELRRAGGTIMGIVDELNRLGMRTRNGKAFVISTVQSILNNEQTFKGMYRYGKNSQWVKGQHEPILE